MQVAGGASHLGVGVRHSMARAMPRRPVHAAGVSLWFGPRRGAVSLSEREGLPLAPWGLWGSFPQAANFCRASGAPLPKTVS